LSDRLERDCRVNCTHCSHVSCRLKKTSPTTGADLYRKKTPKERGPHMPRNLNAEASLLNADATCTCESRSSQYSVYIPLPTSESGAKTPASAKDYPSLSACWQQCRLHIQHRRPTPPPTCKILDLPLNLRSFLSSIPHAAQLHNTVVPQENWW